ncbi:MAG: NUDIX hydrolase [Fibrobacterota bacterium]
MSEYLEELTSTGEKTGRVHTREQIHSNGICHSTAHIWIYHAEKGLLLQKRSKTKTSYPGYWDISAAGHVAPEEAPLATALRECEEEIGHRPEENTCTHLGRFYQSYDFPDKNYYEREFVDVFISKTNKDLRFFSVQPSEVSDLQYIQPEEFSRLCKKKNFHLVPHWEEYKKVLQFLDF